MLHYCYTLTILIGIDIADFFYLNIFYFQIIKKIDQNITYIKIFKKNILNSNEKTLKLISEIYHVNKSLHLSNYFCRYYKTFKDDWSIHKKNKGYGKWSDVSLKSLNRVSLHVIIYFYFNIRGVVSQGQEYECSYYITEKMKWCVIKVTKSSVIMTIRLWVRTFFCFFYIDKLEHVELSLIY